MVKTLKVGKKYQIVWLDHFSTEGWFEKPPLDLHEQVIFATVGFYVKSNKHYHFLAMTHGPTNYGDIMSILKVGVVEINELEEVK